MIARIDLMIGWQFDLLVLLPDLAIVVACAMIWANRPGGRKR